MTTSLLPPNATPHERALEAATARASDVPLMARKVWNPDECPAALLPWLAWAMSVDNWEQGYTEQEKRESIKAAFYVHSHKGTIGAMRAALNALGLGLQVVEWFNDTPVGEPYTFRVTLDVTQAGVSQAAITRAMSVIETSKNLRSHLAGLDLTVITGAAPVFAAVTVAGHDITITAEA